MTRAAHLALDGAGVVALAHESPDAEAFERELLARLQGAIGFDVAFVESKAAQRAPTVAGLDARAFAALGARRATYERELADVERAALAARGVAVDTQVLGVAAVRTRAYHRELAAPVGGGHSLLAYPRLRGRAIGGIVLGRTGASFRAREVTAVEAILPAVALALATFARAPTIAAPSEALTPREREVLEYLCLGYTNREIALACGSSPNTVRNQLVRVFAKLGASTRAEAVALAMCGNARAP